MPRRLPTRAGINTRDIQPERLKHRQARGQRPRLVMAHSKRDEGFVLPGSRGVVRVVGVRRRTVLPPAAAEDEEARAVSFRVLDALGEDVEGVHFRGDFGGDGGAFARRVCGGELRRVRRGGDVLLVDAFEVGGDEGLALAPGLLVRVDFGDVLDALEGFCAGLGRLRGFLRRGRLARDGGGGVKLVFEEVARFGFQC